MLVSSGGDLLWGDASKEIADGDELRVWMSLRPKGMKRCEQFAVVLKEGEREKDMGSELTG